MINEAQPFNATVREALKHYTDLEWLGKNSPLATPYFLGHHLETAVQPNTAAGRGHALQQLLSVAAAAIWPGELPQSRGGLRTAVETERNDIGNGGPRFLYLVLDLRYLRQFYALRTPPTMASAMPDYLTVSESAFYRYLEQAVEALTASLLQLVRPNLRLEQPLLGESFFGRDNTLATSLDALQSGSSLAISGVGGIGKSTLGTAIVSRWQGPTPFWYTFRPGLNDELHSLLFSLGHYLHLNGRSTLWRQLLAAEGKIDSVPQALGLLSSDFAEQPEPLLVCFDEVDLLHTAVSQPRHGIHKQVLELLEGLRPLVPLLFIGQRALIDTAVHFALQPLSRKAVASMIQQSGLGSQLDSIRVHKATQGNPRLVELILALTDTAESDDLLLRRKPAIRPLFNRLWKRLSPDEKRVLGGLAVFRSPAPLDVWQGNVGLKELQSRHLLHQDTSGGVTLLPFFRELVYDELPAGEQAGFHRQAALIRSERGQHTSAAHHLCQADEVETAVNLWYSVQDIEIAQGSAGAAFAIFTEISTDQLKGQPARKLRVIQNRLHLLYGQLEQVLADMDSYSWHPEEELSATAFQQWGEAHRLLGNLDQARLRYENAQTVLGSLSNRMVTLNLLRGNSWLQESDLSAAEREIALAEFEVDYFKGVFAIQRGQAFEAQSYLQPALKLAQKAADVRREARANYLLMMAAGDMGDLDTAHHHGKLAMDYFEGVGDRLNLEGLRAELAGIYLNVGRFAEVIEPAEKALQFFEQIKHGQWPGHICSNLAEAYFETGDLEKAEAYAIRAIQTENPPIQPYAHYTLAQVFEKKGDIEAAEQSFQVGLEIANRNEDQFITAYLYRVYGKFLAGQKRPQEAQNALKSALSLFAKQKLSKEVEATETILGQLAQSL